MLSIHHFPIGNISNNQNFHACAFAIHNHRHAANIKGTSLLLPIPSSGHDYKLHIIPAISPWAMNYMHYQMNHQFHFASVNVCIRKSAQLTDEQTQIPIFMPLRESMLMKVSHYHTSSLPHYSMMKKHLTVLLLNIHVAKHYTKKFLTEILSFILCTKFMLMVW